MLLTSLHKIIAALIPPSYHLISAESMPVAIGRPGFPPLARTLRMIKMPAKDFAPAQPSRRVAFRQSAGLPVCS